MSFWKIYALTALIWMALHFVIFIGCMLILKRDEMGELEELYTRSLYHIFGVILDGIFWPITIPYKLPKMVRAAIKSIQRNQNGSKKGEKR